MSLQNDAFGTERAQREPVLASGLAAWQHELKIKDGETVKFVPLQDAGKTLEVVVHNKQIRVNGGGFRYVVSGSENKHLFAPFAGSPFENSPDKTQRATKVIHLMLVYVLDGNEKIKGHVAFLDAKDNMKRTGAFNIMEFYEKNEEEGVSGHKVTMSRQGSKMLDTVYQTNVGGKYTFTAADNEVIALETPDVVAHLKSLYVKDWTLADLQELYKQNASFESAPATPVTNKVEQDEIPF